MTTPAPDRVSRLFHQALERPLEERRTFLVHACERDESLRAEVESLLACDADSFLEVEGKRS